MMNLFRPWLGSLETLQNHPDSVPGSTSGSTKQSAENYYSYYYQYYNQLIYYASMQNYYSTLINSTANGSNGSGEDRNDDNLTLDSVAEQISTKCDADSDGDDEEIIDCVQQSPNCDKLSVTKQLVPVRSRPKASTTLPPTITSDHVNSETSSDKPTSSSSSSFVNIQDILAFQNLVLGNLNQKRRPVKPTTDQRPKKFLCTECRSGFSNRSQLNSHIRTHTGERPFVCDYKNCQKSFTRNEELTRHRRIHSGIRPYPCRWCEKRFGRKDHLRKHERTHERRLRSTILLNYSAAAAAAAASVNPLVGSGSTSGTRVNQTSATTTSSS